MTLEAEEDRELVRFAEKRERTFDRTKALTHSQVWTRPGRSSRGQLEEAEK